MSLIETTAPISIDLLKQYFENNETKYLIDYDNSNIKGLKLLVYLNNLDIPVDLKIDTTTDEFQDLMLEYFKCPYLINIPSLEIAALEVVFTKRGIIEPTELASTFIDNNKEIVDKWLSMLDSLVLFNMQMTKVPEFDEFVESFPIDNTNNFGVNFVNLLKYDDFYTYFGTVDKSMMKNYTVYFNDYVFKGNNLFHHWAVENNPLFLLTWAVAEGVYEEEREKLITAA